MKETIRFTVNGRPVTLETDPARKLLWVLRTDLDLTGTKYGCGEGICGSCSVLVGERVVKSCRTRLDAVDGREVTTIEGLASDGRLHPLQQAFHEKGGFQCGYCTPGMMLTAVQLLADTPSPTREQIAHGLKGNLCRCTGYSHIIDAVAQASGTTANT